MSFPGGTAPRLRTWIGPAIAVLASLVLLLVPEPARIATARALERTVFAPFRFAVGWGEASLAVQLQLHRLRAERTEVVLEQDRVREVQEENERLRRLLGFRRRTDDQLIAGAVVARDRGRLGDLLWVEVAPGARIPDGAPAVVPDGLIGWATGQDGERVRVACLTNREVTLSVLDQRTREAGILTWVPPAVHRLELNDVPLQSEWKEGDRVITSGLGTVFPRGLLVGWVEGSAPDAAGRGKKVSVRPAASPAQTDELFFLVPEPRGAELAGETDAGTSEPEESAADRAGDPDAESDGRAGVRAGSVDGASSSPDGSPSGLPASDLYPIDPLVEQGRASDAPSGAGVIPVP